MKLMTMCVTNYAFIQLVETHLLWHLSFQSFYFPEHTGLPFFTSGSETPSYIRLEMHYDNPAHAEGMLY